MLRAARGLEGVIIFAPRRRPLITRSSALQVISHRQVIEVSNRHPGPLIKYPLVNLSGSQCSFKVQQIFFVCGGREGGGSKIYRITDKNNKDTLVIIQFLITIICAHHQYP